MKTTLDPKEFYDKQGIYGINRAHLQLMNGLAYKRVARTPAEIMEAESKVKEAQGELTALYHPYLAACRNGGYQAMKLADAVEELKIYTDEEE